MLQAFHISPDVKAFSEIVIQVVFETRSIRHRFVIVTLVITL